MLRNKRGITLVALVVTIIILLILAGVTIAQLTENGLFEKAKKAGMESENAKIEEDRIVNEYEDKIEEYISGTIYDESILTIENNMNKVLSTTDNTELKDANGNKIVVPAGFKIVVDNTTNNAITVEQGIVIEDATETATKGSQFVWIPVGTIIKSNQTTTIINLNRYTFDKDGIAKAQDDSSISRWLPRIGNINIWKSYSKRYRRI